MREGIILDTEAREVLLFIAHEDTEEYIHCILLAHSLLVHEFGPEAKAEFVMNYDRNKPVVRLRIDHDKRPEDATERIERIRETMDNLIPRASRKIHVTG